MNSNDEFGAEKTTILMSSCKTAVNAISVCGHVSSCPFDKLHYHVVIYIYIVIYISVCLKTSVFEKRKNDVYSAK